MRTHPLLLVNPASGDGDPSPEALAAAARAHGVETRVLRDGDDAGAIARAAGADVLGVAGGDGSLAAVAAAAVDLGVPFVCVPTGTRNHFARDVGLDRDDPLAALEAFAGGSERLVDVGRVGNRLFLNNLSLGTYAGLVHRRERHRRRDEAFARLRGLLAVARHRHRLHLRVDGEPLAARVLLVGNNRYELSLFTLGERGCLGEGVLQLWAAPGVLPTAWEERVAPAFRIELPEPHVHAAVDGEAVLLETPLELETLPRALRILLPATSPGRRQGGTVHDNPAASEEEQEAAHEDGRQQEEESMRYPEHHDPDVERERAHGDGKE